LAKRQLLPPQSTAMNQNEEKYLQVLKTLDPELYLIKTALEQTGVNPMILPRVIRVLGNLNIGSGYGEIIILIKSRIVTQIKGNESDILNMPIDSKT